MSKKMAIDLAVNKSKVAIDPVVNKSKVAIDPVVINSMDPSNMESEDLMVSRA